MATSIHCPDCRNEIAIQALRAGRFRSQCPKCSAPFSITMPDGEGARPVVESLKLAPAPATIPAVGSTNSMLPDATPAGASPDPDETITQEIPRNLAPMFHARPPQDDETIEEVRVPPVTFDPPFQPPRALGGYRVGRQVGPTRAGASFEARRRATGRAMALAVVKPRWSAQATFVSRFAREAFAAGHLDHPNLIPPVDVNVDRGFAFTASDAIAGLPLADPRGREGFDRSARVAAVLHAARALQHAHEQGVYHRDLSLGKIRVDGSGLVRLADVGVGLTPDTPEGSAIAPIPLAGSPPMPSADPPSAGFVRDDIAGLGRALQSLVGGERGDRALTPGLATVIRRLLGEGPEAGFTDVGAVVRSLEAELGVGGVFLPRDEEATEFEGCVRAFEEAPLAGLRPKLSMGFAAAVGAFVALTLLAGKPLNTLGVLGFGAIVATSTVAIQGYFGRDPWYDRAREWLLGGGLGDKLTVAASGLLLVGALASTGLLGFWVFLAILAVGLAAARHFALDRPIEQARGEPIARAMALIRSLRRQGIAEDSIRRFACQQGGARWEEFFEALFGYEPLRSARDRWGLDAVGKPRPRFARWRDPIIDAINARLAARRDASDLALFRAIEERNLEARGINLLTARRKSRRIAEAIVLFGRNYRRGGQDASGTPLMDALNRVAQRPDDYLTTAELEEPTGPSAWREALDATVRVLFGPRTRFLLGGVSLAGCLLWMHQNALISADEIKQAGLNATNDREKAVTDAQEIGRKIAANVQGVADAATKTKSLEVDGLSPSVARRLDGFGLGVAGLILIVSASFQGVRFAAFAIPGALVAAIGPHLIEPGARPLGPTSLMSMAIGAGLFAIGVVFGRTRD